MPRLKRGALPKPLKAPGMGKRHSHVTCPVCGGRVARRWLAGVAARPRRWGFEMECLGRRANRKVRDLPVASVRPADIKAWLPGYAEALASMVALTLAEMLEAGWNLGDLTRLARAMRARGLLERVVEQVYAQVPHVPYGKSKVKSFRMGEPVTYAPPRAKIASFTMGEPIGGRPMPPPPSHPPRTPHAKPGTFTMGEPIGMGKAVGASAVPSSPATPAPNAKPTRFTMGEPITMDEKPRRDPG
jgi:hypothetical protein